MIIKEIIFNGPEISGKAHLCINGADCRIDFHDMVVAPGAPDVHIALSKKEEEAVDASCTDISTYMYTNSEFSISLPKESHVDDFKSMIFYCKEFNSFGRIGVISPAK